MMRLEKNLLKFCIGCASHFSVKPTHCRPVAAARHC